MHISQLLFGDSHVETVLAVTVKLYGPRITYGQLIAADEPFPAKYNISTYSVQLIEDLT